MWQVWLRVSHESSKTLANFDQTIADHMYLVLEVAWFQNIQKPKLNSVWSVICDSLRRFRIKTSFVIFVMLLEHLLTPAQAYKIHTIVQSGVKIIAPSWILKIMCSYTWLQSHLFAHIVVIKVKREFRGIFLDATIFSKKFFVAYVHFTSFTYILAFFSELSIFTQLHREIERSFFKTAANKKK